MKKTWRVIIFLLVLILSAQAALAAVDLASVYEAAGVELPNYDAALATLDGEIHAQYGGAIDAEGRFRPGALIMRALLHESTSTDPNPYRMPETDVEKLAFMLAQGLAQVSGQLTFDGKDEYDYTLSGDFAFDAGFDNDMCFVFEVDAELDGDGEIHAQRLSYYLPKTLTQSPFSQDGMDSEAFKLIDRSLYTDRAAWADVIDGFFDTLIAEPRLHPLLHWTLEGGPMPEGYHLDETGIRALLPDLLFALVGNDQLMDAIGQTALPRAVKMAILGQAASEVAPMSASEGGAYIAGLIGAGATAAAAIPDFSALFKLEIDIDPALVALSMRSLVDPFRVEFSYRPAEDGAIIDAMYRTADEARGEFRFAVSDRSTHMSMKAVADDDTYDFDFSALDDKWSLNGETSRSGETTTALRGTGDARGGELVLTDHTSYDPVDGEIRFENRGDAIELWGELPDEGKAHALLTADAFDASYEAKYMDEPQVFRANWSENHFDARIANENGALDASLRADPAAMTVNGKAVFTETDEEPIEMARLDLRAVPEDFWLLAVYREDTYADMSGVLMQSALIEDERQTGLAIYEDTYYGDPDESEPDVDIKLTSTYTPNDDGSYAHTQALVFKAGDQTITLDLQGTGREVLDMKSYRPLKSEHEGSFAVSTAYREDDPVRGEGTYAFTSHAEVNERKHQAKYVDQAGVNAAE